MKQIGGWLVVVAIVVGLVASVTAYVPRLGDITPEDNLTLNAPAGLADDQSHLERDPHATPRPRVAPKSGEEIKLTAELIEQLKADGEERVRVKEFAWSRWEHRWIFLLAAFGLFAGAMMIRRGRRDELAMLAKQQKADADDLSPLELLEAAQEKLNSLNEQLKSQPNHEQRLEAIIHGLDSIHDEQFEPFVGARTQLINQLGMAGFAQLMDRFAAAERQFNRAWSAAADSVLEEAEECLSNGIVLLEEARARLAGS